MFIPRLKTVFKLRPWRILVATLFCFVTIAAIALPRLPATAQQVNRATVIEILDSDRIFIQNQKARVGSIAQRGQLINTEKARGGLRFENNAIIRLGHNTSFLVGSRCVQLQRGRIIVSGSMRGCVGSIVAATRGTIYSLEIGEVAGGQIVVIDGRIDVSNLVDPDSPAIEVAKGEVLTVSLTGRIGAVEHLNPEEFQQILDGPLFQDFQVPLSDAQSPILEQPTPYIDSICSSLVTVYKANLQASLIDTWDVPRPPHTGIWTVRLTYSLHRDGTVSDVKVVQSSGYEALDRSAIDHLQTIKQVFSPFPSCYEADLMEITHRFQLTYQ
ncbi:MULTISPECIES: TonB family protein [Spirulina sp. CCY15215]|uniref:TonB family protein n=1 Tax=Spirulina sp. CCY15215 TaxID=2767591 RepID=UPI001950A28E|nr:TonB family protein [Spirulina major]